MMNQENTISQAERYRKAKQVTLVGAVINALLGCMKVVGGMIYNSHALVADGIHSFSDLLTDIMVVFASKYGSQEADERHPYGHQRIETAATLLLALFLVLAGAGITWDALDELITHSEDMPKLLALPIAIISILANEGLYHYTLYIGNRIQSKLLTANAWHHRSDAGSSIIVVLGLIGSYAGYSYFDALAAILVGAMIIKMGLSYGWNSVKELIDTAVNPETIEHIEATIKAVNGVQRVHQLRSRMMGNDVFIDVHILVAPKISVSEGHYIAQQVHRDLLNTNSNIKDVTVHVDPEDDEEVCPSLNLPNRAVIEDRYIKVWQNAFPSIRSWSIHYLDGKLEIDLVFDLEFNKWDALKTHLEASISRQDDIRCVHLLNDVQIIRFETK